MFNRGRDQHINRFNFQMIFSPPAPLATAPTTEGTREYLREALRQCLDTVQSFRPEQELTEGEPARLDYEQCRIKYALGQLIESLFTPLNDLERERLKSRMAEIDAQLEGTQETPLEDLPPDLVALANEAQCLNSVLSGRSDPAHVAGLLPTRG